MSPLALIWSCRYFGHAAILALPPFWPFRLFGLSAVLVCSPQFGGQSYSGGA